MTPKYNAEDSIAKTTSKPMHSAQKDIIINARFLTQEITGVQRYAIELSRHLKKMDSSIRYVTPSNIMHTDIAQELGVEVIGQRSGHAWEQLDLPHFLEKEGSPLLINLCNMAPLRYTNKITVVHDVAFLKTPKSFNRKFRLFYRLAVPQILRSSKKIITVSNFSRNEILGSYRITESKLSVIHNAATPLQVTGIESETEQPFILAVSSLNARKNLHGLIRAFSILKSRGVHLYIAGGFNRAFADDGLVALIDANPRVHFLGRVSDGELAQLYREAAAFVFPSFYEGFGIPLLEAQSHGCPVVCSNASSFPEVCGDSAVYFSPTDPVDIAAKIDLVLGSSDLRTQLIASGYKNERRFSWDVSARKLYQTMIDVPDRLFD